MNAKVKIALVFSLMFSITPSLEGRGVAGRSPSMSRALSERPAGGPMGSRMDRPESRENADRLLADRPVGRAGAFPGERDRSAVANSVREGLNRDGIDRGSWFNSGFWEGRGFRPPYLAAGRNWWAWGTAAGVGAWLGWGASPIYYGSYYDGDADYGWNQEDQTEAPSAQPSQLSEAPSSSANPEQESSWMPLGVFALVQPGSSAISPNLYLQLALNRDATLAGTLYNSITEATSQVTGLVYKDSQKVAMKVMGESDSPILVTGLYNLTQPQATVLIQFGDGTTQQIWLVRMNQPSGSS